jgi:predicted amidophosphoribosyltransferase
MKGFRRKREEPPKMVCRCGTEFKPAKQEYNENPTREFFCCPRCAMDARRVPRLYEVCQECGGPLREDRKPKIAFCCVSCAVKNSHKLGKIHGSGRKKKVKKVVDEVKFEEPLWTVGMFA